MLDTDERVMEQTNEPSAAERTPDEKLAAKQERTFRLWRYAAQGMARLVARRVRELTAKEQLAKEEDRRIRQITSLILSAVRATEMENQYERKIQQRTGAASDGLTDDERERREEEAYQRAERAAERVAMELREANGASGAGGGLA
jgi:hypothetical protein